MKDHAPIIPWHRSLRFRLVATAVAIEFIMLTLLLANSFRLLDRAVESQTQARLEALSPLLDSALAGRVFHRDHTEVAAILNRLTTAQRAEIRYIAVFEPSGRLIAASGDLDPAAPPGEDKSVAGALTDLTYDTRLPLTIMGNEVGSVRFGLSLASMVATQNQVVREGVFIASVEILLSLLLLATGGYLITRHIRALTLGTRRVAEGDYSVKIHIPGHDEIATLAGDFNTMSAAVSAHVHELRTSEMRFAAIFNAVGEAIFVHDAETGEILDVNQRMCQMFGYTREEALKIDFAAISANTPLYTKNEALARMRAAVADNPQVFDWLARAKDGRSFWIEVSLRTARIGEHDRLIAVMRDISERKKAEEAVAAETERLAVTLRSIGDGVITTDTEGRIMLLNAVAEKLTGWTQNEARGMSLADVFNIVNEQTREICENPVEKVMSSGQIIGLANHTVLIARDGTERQIADSGAPIRDRESRIIGVVLVFRDVTEKVRMEGELLKVRKLESVGILAGGIAHDFNNILAAILGNINLVLTDPTIAGRSRTLLSEAEKASIRAKDLTRQLLTFSKGGEPVKETASIREVIRDSAEFVLHGGTVACSYSIPEDLWLVDVDKGQMSQVIQNIIINAKQSMPKGGTIRISGENVDPRLNAVRLLPDKSRYIGINISDTGIGIPAGIIDKIFDPYFTTKQEGSGLGLTIAHSIVSKHNGFMSAQSTVGEGTTFTIYLPASDGQQEQQQECEPLVTSVGKARIIVMDDERMIRDLTKAMLEMLGHEVVLARRGEEAIELYRKHRDSGEPIDISIMDLTIPGGMGGKLAVQEILAMKPDAKVVVSSGYSNDPVMARHQEFGFCAAIVKPFQLHEIAKVINQILSAG